MASPEVLLQRPFWSVANTLVLPIRSDEDGDGAPALRSIVSLSLPVTIFLDVLLGERSSSSRSRSLGEDQAGIFRAVEASLAGVGVDGRACLLRLICHLQSRPIGQYTVVGEVLMLLFTPKREAVDFLQDYQEAEMAGLDGGDCASLYPSCPFSLPPALMPALYEDTTTSSSSSSEGQKASPSSPYRDLALPGVVLN
ncbi:uncharacterized protein LOC126986157 isoform X2 [Eriocheir sinensis]|uniref:uncharacterized protein LOC126986157 isoform X2 n=1 Tax=Eriocheir sinensis TaxID=95602 RepID=UPI0021C6B28F|nr:uncharacterized protein LOC126986157 isoform X2 [Eriocheir sinensis]